jgi:subtilase family serine protease
MRSQRVDAGDVLAALGTGQVTAAQTGPPQPCSAYFGQLTASVYPEAFGTHPPFAVCGYTPAQLRSAYDTDDATGEGVTVAVLDAYGSPTIVADANEYASRHGDPPFHAGQYTEKVNSKTWTLQSACGGTASWAAEQTLDVEAVHALAPGANVLYYSANSCQDSDLLAAFTDIVAHHSADVVTASWGGPLHSTSGDVSADVIRRYDRLFQVAALEGITVDFSSGDCGVNAPTTKCGGAAGLGSSEPQTSFPAADPWVTAVGGTSVEIGRDGSIRNQTAWGTRAWKLDGNVTGSGTGTDGESDATPGAGWQPMGWIYGGGGGTSADFAAPWYQRRLVPSSLAGTLLTGVPAMTPRRVVPDVALDADPFTGMLVGQTRQSVKNSPKSGSDYVETYYAESAVGGTSLASPLLAALEADAIQLNCGRPLGFINPSLYARGRTSLLSDVEAASSHLPPPSEIFPPIPGKPAVLAGLGDDGPLLATPGYDTATGLGAPGDDFAARLAGL